MATPPTYDINFYAGDTESFSMALKNADGTIVEGLEGTTAKMDIKRNFKDPPTLSKESSIDPLTGIFTFNFSSEETALLMGENDFTQMSYKYDVQIDDLVSSKTIVRGTLIVTEDVTRP